MDFREEIKELLKIGPKTLSDSSLPRDVANRFINLYSERRWREVETEFKRKAYYFGYITLDLERFYGRDSDGPVVVHSATGDGITYCFNLTKGSQLRIIPDSFLDIVEDPMVLKTGSDVEKDLRELECLVKPYRSLDLGNSYVCTQYLAAKWTRLGLLHLPRFGTGALSIYLTGEDFRPQTPHQYEKRNGKTPEYWSVRERSRRSVYSWTSRLENFQRTYLYLENVTITTFILKVALKAMEASPSSFRGESLASAMFEFLHSDMGETYVPNRSFFPMTGFEELTSLAASTAQGGAVPVEEGTAASAPTCSASDGFQAHEKETSLDLVVNGGNEFDDEMQVDNDRVEKSVVSFPKEIESHRPLLHREDAIVQQARMGFSHRTERRRSDSQYTRAGGRNRFYDRSTVSRRSRSRSQSHHSRSRSQSHCSRGHRSYRSRSRSQLHRLRSQSRSRRSRSWSQSSHSRSRDKSRHLRGRDESRHSGGRDQLHRSRSRDASRRSMDRDRSHYSRGRDRSCRSDGLDEQRRSRSRVEQRHSRGQHEHKQRHWGNHVKQYRSESSHRQHLSRFRDKRHRSRSRSQGAGRAPSRSRSRSQSGIPRHLDHLRSTSDSKHSGSHRGISSHHRSHLDLFGGFQPGGPSLNVFRRVPSFLGCRRCGAPEHLRRDCLRHPSLISCLYCKERGDHVVEICPILMGSCERCKVRGHLRKACHSPDLEQCRERFERYADLGRLSKLRFRLPAFGFFLFPRRFRRFLREFDISYGELLSMTVGEAMKAIDNYKPSRAFGGESVMD